LDELSLAILRRNPGGGYWGGELFCHPKIPNPLAGVKLLIGVSQQLICRNYLDLWIF